MKKSVLKKSTDKNKDNVKHLKSKDLTQERLFGLGGAKGKDVHLKRLNKSNKNKDYYT